MTAARDDADVRARRIYVVGDIHGRLDMLERALAAIRHDNAARPWVPTRIVLLGNIVDRGLETAAVVDLCMRMRDRTGSFVVLKGAHEAMMVAALRGDLAALEAWLSSGGRESLESWGLSPVAIDGLDPLKALALARQAVPPETAFWLDALPSSWREGRYLFWHGSLDTRAAARPDARALALVCSDIRVRRRLIGRTGVRCRFSRIRMPMADDAQEAGDPLSLASLPVVVIGLEQGQSWQVELAEAADTLPAASAADAS